MDGISAAELLTCLLLAWASACDLRTRRIPNACSLGGVPAVAAASIAAGSSPATLLLAAGCAGLFFGGASVLRPDGLGAGDAKLAVLVAAGTGATALPALVLGLALGAGWCLSAWVCRGGASLAGMTVPLAPFIAAGVAVTLALAG